MVDVQAPEASVDGEPEGARIESLESLARVERLLRGRGFSRKEARAVIARVQALSRPADAAMEEILAIARRNVRAVKGT